MSRCHSNRRIISNNFHGTLHNHFRNNRIYFPWHNSTALLQSLQLSVDQQGLAQLASRSQHRDELLISSAQLSELLEQCRAANLLNGRVIRTSQISTNSILGILRGGETPDLYDSRGSTARIAQQRPLSQA